MPISIVDNPEYVAAKRVFAVIVIAVGLTIIPPAYAQKDDPDTKPVLTAEEVIERSRERTAAVRPKPKCPEPSGDDGIITVCAQIDDGAAYRVPPSTTSRAALGGPPPAPDVAGAGIFKGKPTMGGMCFLPPCPRGMPPMVDFSKFPEFDHEYAAKAREAARLERLRQEQEAEAENSDADEGKNTPQP